MLSQFGSIQIAAIVLLFVWAGFVRTGIGFGGAALGLPLLLLIHDQPIDWLPVIGLHLLFFSGLTLRTRLRDVDWRYLRNSSPWIVPPALVGVFGLITLPNRWLVIFIYAVTLFYALIWVTNRAILSRGKWFDRALLIVGGYVAGTSLTGAPFMVAVYMRHVARHQLRNTLFVLWIVMVVLKLGTFTVVGVTLHAQTALLLLAPAAIGHVLGLKAHDWLMRDDRRFKQIIGGALIAVSAFGLWKAW